MAYVRPGILLRGIKHQLSCLSVRGFQHISSQESTADSISQRPYLGQLFKQDTKLDTSFSLHYGNTRIYCFLNRSVTDTIVDNIKPVPIYDCPKINNQKKEISVPSHIINVPSVPIGDPDTRSVEMESPGTSSIEKLAHTDRMRIRHRKMKKHKQRRRKARFWPKLRKIKYQKEMKKAKIFQKQLEKIKSYGTDFDAFAEVKDSLAKARKMGYTVDIFGEKSKTFGFLDDLKKRI